MKPTALLVLTLFAACSGPQKRTFMVSTINTNERPVSCLILLEDTEAAYKAALEQHQFTVETSPSPKEIAFPTGKSEIRVLIKPFELDKDGLQGRGRGRLETSPYLPQRRTVRITDAPHQLFILEETPNF
jgi:hypothetical protein